MKKMKKKKTIHLRPQSKQIVRLASSLSREELDNLVSEIQEVLWVDGWHATRQAPYWNPEKEWDSGVLDTVANVLHRYKLAPTRRGGAGVTPMLPMLPFKVEVGVTLSAYAKVEIQAESQVEAEIKADTIIETEGGFDTDLAFEPDWNCKESLRVVPVDRQLYVKRQEEIADESLYSEGEAP